jgi:hypothetical protein
MVGLFSRCLLYGRNARAGSGAARFVIGTPRHGRSFRTVGVGRARMMPPRNTIRGLGSTMTPAGDGVAFAPAPGRGRTRLGPGLTTLTLALAAGLGLSFAAPAPATQSATAPATPDVTDAARAAVTAADWLRVFDVPSPGSEAATVPLTGGTAARVALRTRGRIVADVQETIPLFGADANDPAGVAAAREGLLRRTAGRAMAAALGDRVIASLRETLGDSLERSLGARLTLELELAGPLVPLAGRRLEAIALQLEPGLDGIALRWRDQVALAFPAQMTANGSASNISRVLPRLTSDLGLPIESYAELRDRFDARLYRFRTLHFVQRRPGDAPGPRVRGQELVTTAAIRTPTVVAAGRDLFNHVISRLWAVSEPIGLRGDYDASVDGYRPVIASSREQALVAYALARWAGAPGVRPDDRMRGGDAAVVVLEELRSTAIGERPALEDPVTAAAIVLAESELRRVDAGAGLPRALPPAGPAEAGAAAEPTPGAPVVIAADRRELLARAATDVTVLVATLAATADAEGIATLLDPHDRAVLVAAAARHALAPGAIPANDPRELTRALEAVRASVPAGELISLMPWLAMAEADVSTLTGVPLPAERVELLRAIRAVLERIQISRLADGGGPADLEGGFALTVAPVPLAGAQSIRPVILLAWMLGRPELSPDDAERAVHRDRLRVAMRFLRQLAVRDADLWSIRGPSRAIGGIRAATWDLRMPLAAQAMGLLAYAEVLYAIDAIGPLEGP